MKLLGDQSFDVRKPRPVATNLRNWAAQKQHVHPNCSSDRDAGRLRPDATSDERLASIGWTLPGYESLSGSFFNGHRCRRIGTIKLCEGMGV